MYIISSGCQVYGNNMEIQALSEMYNRPIHIYSYGIGAYTNIFSIVFLAFPSFYLFKDCSYWMQNPSTYSTEAIIRTHLL